MSGKGKVSLRERITVIPSETPVLSD